MNVFSLLATIFSFFLGPLNLSTSIPEITPTPVVQTQPTVIYQEREYAYAIVGPIDSDTVTLYSNLPGKKTSQELKTEYSCRYLINGGFYGKDDRPIGLFLTDGIVRREQVNSALFNAFIAKPTQGNPTIANRLPDTDLQFALQSGPQLLDTGNVRVLSLKQDEQARRMAVGVDTNGMLYFFSIYSSLNPYSGPLLKDLPAILNDIAKKEALSLTDALNLDGGNHSALYGNTVVLHELSPIGSFFCIQES